MTAAKRLLVLEEVACIRGQRLLFQNLCCGLEQGDALHLAGPNGAGKSSLLRMMAGALPLAAGRMLWEDRPFLEKGPEVHARRLAFLPPDDRSLKVLETSAENLSFWAQLAETSKDNNKTAVINKTVVVAALSGMGLEALAAMPVRRLSAGQRRRLSLARLLLAPRALWLLDEPFNGLDAGATALFDVALNRHLRAGGMAVIASHQGVTPPEAGALRRIDLGAGGLAA